MPYCGNCGKKFDDDLRFCPFCGAPNRLTGDTGQEPEPGIDSGDYGDKAKGGTYLGESGEYGLDVKSLSPGTILEERFEIVERLGSGSFAAVYKAKDRHLNERLKALKIIFAEHYDDQLLMQKLQEEAETMMIFNHPNILRLFDIHLTGSIRFLDLEYIDQGDLTDLIIKYPEQKVPEAKVLEIAGQIAAGMQEIHQARVIHKDLKPANIMLTKSGIVKISDFGISEAFSHSQTRLQETSRAGTFNYMSPEQLRGMNVGRESDIWSFGIICNQMLTGRLLYRGTSPEELLEQMELRPFIPEPEMSEFISSLLSRCLQLDYQKRFRNFEEVIKFMETKGTDKANSLNQYKSKAGVYMIAVKGGSFNMGSNDGDSDEKPIHRVTVSDFYIGKYEVTQENYEKVMGKNPSYFTNAGKNAPVESVSWYDAVEFCNKLSEMEGLNKCYSGSGGNIKCDFSKNGYRLPTEAEWEYAARGGNQSKGYKYSGSNNLKDVGWNRWNLRFKTYPVGYKKANELGIYDMSGNVWEWCWDWYGSYSCSSQTDPCGPSSGSYRVYRGGSWSKYSGFCRSADRFDNSPGLSGNRIGFRLARSSPR
jgi:formylglycine-generating enzyme